MDDYLDFDFIIPQYFVNTLNRKGKEMRNAMVFMALALFLASCAALPVPLAAPKGTPILSSSGTAKPTMSSTPGPSTTPEPTETLTESPSATPESMVSPTPTVLFPSPSPSPTPTIPSKLACKLMWQSPGNEISYEPGKQFSVGWNVMNNGTDAWDADSVEFTYLGGAKLYDYALVHLKTSVAPGQEVVLSVHMKAPRNPTRYTTYWSLRQGNTFFCRLMLSIFVE